MERPVKKILATAALTVAGLTAAVVPAAAHDLVDADVDTGDISVLDGAEIVDDVNVLNGSCVAPVNADVLQVQALVENDDPYVACAPFRRG